MKVLATSWQFWALLSAIFAAATAVLAKVGVTNLHPDLASFIRTLIVLAFLGMMLAIGGQWRGADGLDARAMLFLVLSGLATGASWLCYFRALKLGDAAQVAPVDKLSVVLVALFATIFLGEKVSATGWIGIGLIATGTIVVAIAP
jgi:bacterial/archaeal transporter family protein